MIARLARVAIWISTLASATANAAYSNYNSVLIGSQAAGMGGAYTALYQDSSAVAFYNPALQLIQAPRPRPPSKKILIQSMAISPISPPPVCASTKVSFVVCPPPAEVF